MSRKIVSYVFLDSTSSHCLASDIEKWIEKDWQPYGSPLQCGDRFYQAIVKYEEINISCDPGMIKVLL